MFLGVNVWLIFASFLTWAACLVHCFIGDREIRTLLDHRRAAENTTFQETWTMARCGWHWISADLLTSAIVLTLITFTDIIGQKDGVLLVIAGYFLVQALVWLVSIAMSTSFRNNFVRLGQWLLLITVAVLILLGRSSLE